MRLETCDAINAFYVGSADILRKEMLAVTVESLQSLAAGRPEGIRSVRVVTLCQNQGRLRLHESSLGPDALERSGITPRSG